MKSKHLNNLFVSRPQSSFPLSATTASRSSSKRATAAVAFLALAAAIPSAQAAIFTWAGTSDDYNAIPSWTGGAAPISASNTSTDDVVFSNNGSPSFVTPTLTAYRVLQSLTFTADAPAYTITSNNTLAVRNVGGLVNDSASTQTFTNAVMLHSNSGNFTNSKASGSLVFNGGIQIGNGSANRILTLAGVGTVTVVGAIVNGGTSTSAAVNVTSTGVTTFNGNNTYDGTTTMNAVGGTLSLNGDNSGATGAVTITAGTVKIGHGNALGSTTAATSVASGAVLDLNGQTVGAEAVSITGTGISSGGALVNTSATSASLSGAVTLAGDASIGGTGNIALVNIGQSGGTRGLTKVGAGTLTLSGTKSYTGTTTIAGGTLDITGGNSAAGIFTLSGSGGPVLKLSHLNALATTATIDGTSSSGLLGTLDLAVAGNYTLGTFSKGNVRFSASSGESTTLTFTNNSTVSNSADGGRTLTNSSSNLHVIFGGDLDISSSTANSGVTFASVGNTTVNGAIFNGSGQTRTLAKSNSGTLTLNGANTYSGATTISQGTLTLGASGSIANSTSITVGASATFNVSAVTGGYTLGAGQTLSGSGTVTGAMTVAGTLSPGSSPGILATGNEIWTNGGDYNFQMLNAAGVAGTGFDQIQVTGTLNLNSLTANGFAINLWSLSSISPDVSGNALFDNTISQSWNILTTTGGITGFEAGDFVVNVDPNNDTNGFSNALGGGSFSIDADANNLILKFTAVPEPGAALLGGLGLLALLRRRR